MPRRKRPTYDVISADTKVERLVIAYNLCADEGLADNSASRTEILASFDRLKAIRNNAVAHVDEKSDVYTLTEEADYYRAPPDVNRIAAAEIGIQDAILRIAYQLPEITAEDRDALHRLTATTADIYFQMRRTGRLLNSGSAGPHKYGLKVSIYNPDDTLAAGMPVDLILLPKILSTPKYRISARSDITGEI